LQFEAELHHKFLNKKIKSLKIWGSIPNFSHHKNRGSIPESCHKKTGGKLVAKWWRKRQ
jgi:hypothetical protein